MARMTVLHVHCHITSRPLAGEADWWQVRNLLIDTYPLTPTDMNWDLRRWDGQRFHREDTALDARWSNRVRLWFAAEDRIVAAAHPEGAGDVYLQVHPDYRHLEEEMLDWAELELAAPVPETAVRQLHAFAYDYDSPRQRLLHDRGYGKTSEAGVARRLRLGHKVLPQPDLAEGYRLRTTRAGVGGDCQRLADLLNAAFRRTSHTAAEYHNFSTLSPSFRHDLNLVAENGDGAFAAHVGVTFDEANHRGIFEPVCTHPDHRRRGLARSLMFEGLLRLRDLGAMDVYVGTGDDPAANQLYEAVGFTEAYRGNVWRKQW